MEFDPTQHPNILYYIPPFADEPLDFWQEISSVTTHPAVDGDPVGTIETDVASVLFTGASSAAPDRRIRLGANGGIKTTANDQGIRHASNKTRARPIHENRQLFAIAAFRYPASPIATRPIIDNTNVSNTTAGFFVGTQNQTTNARPKIQINNGTGIVFQMIPDEPVNDDADHVLIGYCTTTPGESFAQVDNGRKFYQNALLAGGAVDATFDTFLLNRASFSFEWPGEVYAVGVYTDHPGQDAIDEWLTRFPKGTLVGSPEMRVGNFHLNLSNDMQYIASAIWVNGYRVSPISAGLIEHGEGPVINDGVSTDGGWAGGPHLSETVSSMRVWVDGVEGTFADGDIYEGSSVVKVERKTTIGVSFDNTETITVGPNYKRDHVRLVRLGDARTVGTTYIVRNSRTVDYQPWASFDADGAQIDEGTVTSTDGQALAVEDEAGIALAQFDAVTNNMALMVITRTNCTNYDWIVVRGTDNRRVYLRIYDDVTGEGTMREMEILTKFYSTDSGSWKALAASELGKILSGAGMAPINHRRRG